MRIAMSTATSAGTSNAITAGLDRGWLDQAQFVALAPLITREPLSQIADSGAMVDLNVATTGTKPQ